MQIKEIPKYIFKNEVSRNSIVYIVSSVLSASIPFLLLPLMTSCLTPADYGITAMFQVVLAFLIPMIGLNSEGATGTEYFRQIYKNLSRYIGNALLLVVVSFIVCLLIVSIFSSQFSSILDLPRIWVVLAAVQSLFQFIIVYVLALLQASKQPVKYGLLQIGLSVLNAGFSIWLVYGLMWGYQGRLVGNLGAVVIVAIIAFIYLVRKYHVDFRFDKVLTIDILKYGVPLIPHALGGWAMSLIDRVFLADMIGLDTVGLYSVAFQLASVFAFLTAAVNQAFAPWLYSQLAVNDSIGNKRRIVKFSYAVMSLFVVCAIVYLALMPVIKSIFINSRYHDINLMFAFLLIGFVLQGFYFMFTNYISFIKKTKYQAAVTVSVAIIKLPLTYVLIQYFGAVGAAYSFALTYFLFFAVTAIVSNKLYPMPWLRFYKL